MSAHVQFHAHTGNAQPWQAQFSKGALMYFWKYWRDTRVRLIVLLMLVAARGALQLLAGRPPVTVMSYWQQQSLAAWAFLAVPGLLALGFAMPGPGEEFAQGTADFMFTRPRPRRFFIWASWATGALEILAIISVYVLTVFLSAVYVTGTVYTWNFLVMILPAFLMCFVAYGIICFISTLLRSGQKGYGSGVVLIVLYLALKGLLQMWWSIHLPFPTDLANSFEGLVTGGRASTTAFHFPVASVIGWTLLAVACPLFAQLYIERTEI